MSLMASRRLVRRASACGVGPAGTCVGSIGASSGSTTGAVRPSLMPVFRYRLAKDALLALAAEWADAALVNPWSSSLRVVPSLLGGGGQVDEFEGCGHWE